MGELATGEDHSHFSLGYFILLSVTVIFIVYSTVMNVILVLSILKGPTMREKLFFRIILVIAVSQFLQSILVIPHHIGVNGGIWKYGYEVCAFWHLADLTLREVLVFLFLMLMIERFFSLTYPMVAQNICFGSILILSPWIFAATFVLFLYYAMPSDFFPTYGIQEQQATTFDTCRLGYYVEGLYSLGFLFPAVFVFGFSWGNWVVVCLLRRRTDEAPFEDNPKTHTVASCVISMCFIAMWFPANSKPILPAEMFPGDTTSLYVGFANAALTPSLWVVIPSLKDSFHKLCCCSCCSGAERRGRRVRSTVTEETRAMMFVQEESQPPYSVTCSA